MAEEVIGRGGLRTDQQECSFETCSRLTRTKKKKKTSSLLSVSTVSHIIFFSFQDEQGNATEIANTGITTNESVRVNFLVSLGEIYSSIELSIIYFPTSRPTTNPFSVKTETLPSPAILECWKAVLSRCF
jgi:hypothetical protein